MPQEKWKDVDKFEPKYNIQPGANALVVVKDDEVSWRMSQCPGMLQVSDHLQ